MRSDFRRCEITAVRAAAARRLCRYRKRQAGSARKRRSPKGNHPDGSCLGTHNHRDALRSLGRETALPGDHPRYQSDFDLLIIVNDRRLTDRVKHWSRHDERMMRDYGVTGTLRTPVNFIVHTLQEVNDGLAHGRYFFMDVKQEGVALAMAQEYDIAIAACQQLQPITESR